MVFAYPSRLSTINDHESTNASLRTLTPERGIARQRSFLPFLSFEDPRKQRSLKIVLSCGLIVLPMLVFSIALLWIVFTNLVDQTPCPFPDLCPGSDLLNTTSGGYYYVDFSATRLAFLASLSSSISFSLVSILMSIYAYSVAKNLLSSSVGLDHANQLPSPYQLSILIRILNAELLMLWEIFWRKAEEIFWHKERTDDSESSKKFPPMVRTSVLFFLFAVSASIYIQVADTYLHISTKSVNFVVVQSESSAQHQYSRGLSQWCLDRPTLGSMDNKNFFSCSISHKEEKGLGNSTYLSNSSSIFAIDNRVSSLADIYSFDHEDGDTYAVVGPANIDPSLDWKASSFGVSTKCSNIPVGACEVQNATIEADRIFWPISCSKISSGIDFDANITQSTTQHAYLDFHKYLGEQSAFSSKAYTGWKDSAPLVPNITDTESNDVFRNPWHWVHVLKYADDVPHDSEEYLNDPDIWRLRGSHDFVLQTCNSTVWDVNYTAVGGKITSLSRTKSNGSVAGISSMATSRAPNFMAPSFSRAYNTANFVQTSPESFTYSWKAAVSRVLAMPLGAQSGPRPSELVQRRSFKVVTRLPKAAVWVLVSSNMIFALLGLGLTIAALRRTSAEAYQVHTRLGVAGLSAALFEAQHSSRVAREDSKLFEENVGRMPVGGIRKKVGVILTHEGGAGFVLNRTKT